MANIKFFKKATRPTSAGVGSVWFDSTRKAIVLTGATASEDVVYSGCITNAVVDGETLKLTKTDGNVITVDFAVFATDAALNSGLSTKVDKVNGKGLSTNDFTTDEKNKLAGIAAGANAYSLPIASATVLGGIKVGNNLTISNGVLSGTPDSHYANTFTIKGAGTAAAIFDQSSDATLNIAAGTGISVSATSGTITIANTVANTHLKNFLDIQAAGTSVVKYTQDSDKTLKFVAGSNVTLTPNAANGTITISSTDTNTDTKVTSVGNHYTPSGGTAKTNGNVLTSVTCDAAGHVTSVGGRNDIPASWLTGTIDIARLPAGALERLFVVADEAAAMKANVQEGDTVKITGNNNKMYFCVKAPTAGATFATCFTEYTAGSATSVPWSGVTGKPSTFTPSAHTHDDRYYTKTEINTKLNDKVDNSSDGADSLLSKLTTTWIAPPDDNTYFIRQDVGGTNTFGRVKFSTLWSYIKGKTDPTYAAKRHSHTKNDIDDFPAIPTVNDPKVSIKMNGAEKGSFTLNQASAGEVDLGTVLTAHQDISGKVDKTLNAKAFEAITIYDDEMDVADGYAQNLKNIAAYKRNLEALGVDTSKPYIIPIGLWFDPAGLFKDAGFLQGPMSMEGRYQGYVNGRLIYINATTGEPSVERLVTNTKISPIFEAVTIYIDNTPEHMQANIDNIKAYEDNVRALGIYNDNNCIIPIKYDELIPDTDINLPFGGFITTYGGYEGFITSTLAGNRKPRHIFISQGYGEEGKVYLDELNATDTTMSDTSTNPVQNKVIKAYIDELVGNVATWTEYE